MTKLPKKELDHIAGIISKEASFLNDYKFDDETVKSACHKASVKIESYLTKKGRLSTEEDVSIKEKLKYVKRMLNEFVYMHVKAAKKSGVNFHTVKRIHRLENPNTGNENINKLYRYFKGMNK